jgi:hypothetical protein
MSTAEQSQIKPDKPNPRHYLQKLISGWRSRHLKQPDEISPLQALDEPTSIDKTSLLPTPDKRMSRRNFLRSSAVAAAALPVIEKVPNGPKADIIPAFSRESLEANYNQEQLVKQGTFNEVLGPYSRLAVDETGTQLLSRERNNVLFDTRILNLPGPPRKILAARATSHGDILCLTLDHPDSKSTQTVVVDRTKNVGELGCWEILEPEGPDHKRPVFFQEKYGNEFAYAPPADAVLTAHEPNLDDERWFRVYRDFQAVVDWGNPTNQAHLKKISNTDTSEVNDVLRHVREARFVGAVTQSIKLSWGGYMRQVHAALVEETVISTFLPDLMKKERNVVITQILNAQYHFLIRIRPQDIPDFSHEPERIDQRRGLPHLNVVGHTDIMADFPTPDSGVESLPVITTLISISETSGVKAIGMVVPDFYSPGSYTIRYQIVGEPNINSVAITTHGLVGIKADGQTVGIASNPELDDLAKKPASSINRPIRQIENAGDVPQLGQANQDELDIAEISSPTIPRMKDRPVQVETVG